MDVFTVTITGTVINAPTKTEKGNLIFKVQVDAKNAKGICPLFVEVIAKEKAAETIVSQGDKVSVINATGFISLNKNNGCSFSLGVKDNLKLHVISHFDGIKDAKSELC